MSYYCEISFKHIPREEVDDFLRVFKRETTAHITDIAKDNFNYVPYIRHSDFAEVSKPMTREEWRALPEEQRKALFPRDFRNVDAQTIDNARYWARSCVFHHKYCYDKERQLLGVFGVHPSVQGIFDGTVSFQNSCDQDYERVHWEGIPAFEAIFDKWQGKSEAEMLKWYKQEYGTSLYDDLERMATPAEAAEQFAYKLAYARRSAAYKEIWDNYESTLYNDEDALYISLYGSYEIAPVTGFIKACHDAQVDWRDEGDKDYFEMLCGMRPEMRRWVERMCKEPLDVKHELALFMEKHPGYLEKFPDLQAPYESTLAELETADIGEVK